jgi:hypothetical protein
MIILGGILFLNKNVIIFLKKEKKEKKEKVE